LDLIFGVGQKETVDQFRFLNWVEVETGSTAVKLSKNPNDFGFAESQEMVTHGISFRMR